MPREFKDIYDATEFVKELVGAANYPVVSDHMTQMIVEGAQVVDSNGYQVTDTGYSITVDVNKAASDIFGIKAGYASVDYDFKSDNQSFSRSQIIEHLLSMQKYYQKNTFSTFPANKTVEGTNQRFKLPYQYDLPENC